MIKNREKRIKKMRRNHVWITFVAFFVVCVIATIIMLALSELMGWYILNSKIDSQFAVVKNMEKAYSEIKQEETDEDTVEKVMALSSGSFAVLDKDGKVIFGKDYQDLGEYDGTFRSSSSNEEIMLYKSSENKIITVDKGELSTQGSFFSLIKNIYSMVNDDTKMSFEVSVDQYDVDDDGNLVIDPATKAENDKAIQDFYDSINKTLNIPLWLGIKSYDGNTIVSKSVVSLSFNDYALMIVIFLTVEVLGFCIFVILVVSIIVTLVNQRKNMNLYFTDTMTLGANRNMFLYNGEKWLKKRKNLNKSYAVVSLVLLKYNNYCLCHSMKDGEIILTKMHKLLKSNMTKGEIAAHMTIAEFALLMNYSTQEEIESRLKTIIEQLDAVDPDHAFVFHAGVKVIEPARENADERQRKHFDLETEYNNACTARTPRDDKDDTKILFFDDKLIEEQHWEDKIIENQFKAIENEEFLIYYQPKYEPNTNKLSGAEALIRWNSPELGFVSPGRFIPQFEKSGFITEIDHYMLKHVAQDQKTWLDQGFECVPVSVNVSRAHFVENDLAEQIRDVVDAAGAPRHLIEIELTESAFFDDKKALINTITRLKEYGFTVSMDDFGSGYSSLNSLKDIPLDVLKLDAGFFSGDISDDRSGIVVSETIRLAKSLNMKTVAEGVEEKEQVEFLAAKGCDMIQGYYYSKPLPGNEYEQKMEKVPQ